MNPRSGLESVNADRNFEGVNIFLMVIDLRKTCKEREKKTRYFMSQVEEVRDSAKGECTLVF